MSGAKLAELVVPFAQEQSIEKSYLSAICDLMKRHTFSRHMDRESVFL